MIYVAFSLDYEIYGNGSGDLNKLVISPTEKMIKIFSDYNVKFTNFVECGSLYMFKNIYNIDLNNINKQILQLYANGHEIGLHIHPQWFNSEYKNNQYFLNFSEVNLCTLSSEKIKSYLKKSISYLNSVIGEDYVPISFRSGLWLMQPSQPISGILYELGIRIDSSLFKGGVFKNYNVDYSRSIKNSYYWKFSKDVNIPDPDGILYEFPIYSKMSFILKSFNRKKINISLKRPNFNKKTKLSTLYNSLKTFRLYNPTKLDFCKLTFKEMINMLKREIELDKKDYNTLRPIVFIGHSKNLFDVNTIKLTLDYLMNNNIQIGTFQNYFNKYLHDATVNTKS